VTSSDADQRHYRAPCPGCGAPVEFHSAQSTYAVCPYCRSTVVRQGDTLARIGKMAELFDDFSPLQLFAAGRIQDHPFTLIGRRQYGYEGGRWTEWIAALDGDRVGILSEDNGAFVFSLPFDLKRTAPASGDLRVGATTAFDGQSYTVASNEQVALVSAQGEMRRLPDPDRRFAVVELRGERGQVLSLDYSTDPPVATLGRAVQLEELQLTGLRDESAKEEKGRNFNCPNCGATVTVNLADSKSITCASCHSIIDLTQGIGGELRHALQDEPVKSLIPLGTVGRMQGVDWQVVGFQHRMGKESADDDEAFGWSEYLLYNRQRGFSFLVDAEDGWSLVKPTTGAPTMAKDGLQATYLGNAYRQLYAYNAETNYVAGEFYWQVQRGQKTFNRDFANGAALLSMERSVNEITWSAGSKIDSAAVAAAFKLDARKDLFKRADASPVSAGSKLSLKIIIILVVLFVLLSMLSTCSDSNNGGGSYRSSGGSYGGYSSGGGHK
jgi:ribosomal protein S27E